MSAARRKEEFYGDCGRHFGPEHRRCDLCFARSPAGAYQAARPSPERLCLQRLVLAALAYAPFMNGGTAIPIVSTDDAYVGAVFAQVTPQIDGTIGAIQVHDTQYVHKGDIIVTLDPKDAQLDFVAAKATYEEAYRRVHRKWPTPMQQKQTYSPNNLL